DRVYHAVLVRIRPDLVKQVVEPSFEREIRGTRDRGGGMTTAVRARHEAAHRVRRRRRRAGDGDAGARFGARNGFKQVADAVLYEDTVRIGDRSERHVTGRAQPCVRRGAVAAHDLVRVIGEVGWNPPDVLPDHQQALRAVCPTG